MTVKNEEQANQIIEKFNGYQLKDSQLKIEVAQPRSKGKEEGEQPASTAVSNGSSKRNNKGGGKSRKPATTSEPESVQPDPRWAQELEKLKQLLAAQTANS